MTAREHVRLSDHTTLRVGGPARCFAEAGSQAELVALVRAADDGGEPLLVLGGGSNLVVADEGFPGTVIKVALRGISRADAGPGAAVTVAAGEEWDSVVAWSLSEGLAGLECLSGIPGLAGATPIQNVGAYGQEVAETITSVAVYDRHTATVTGLAAASCGFGYRTSAFKRDIAGRAGARRGSGGGGWGHPGGVTGRYVVLGVTFHLQRSALSAPVRYRELAATLGVAEGERAPLADVRAAVLRLRRAKGMLLDPADPDSVSAGSFFTNPVLDRAQFAALTRAVAAALGEGVTVPVFPAPCGQVKVPAAWLIEHAGFGKGHGGAAGNGGGPRISAKHTLALVNPGGATAASLVSLARQIRDRVRARFGVELAPEPVLVGISL
jgi:UDP-N-acetylmuramate dehydrogenase